MREVPQGLPEWPGFLGVEAEMVGIAQHLFEYEPGISQPRRVGATGPGEGLDQPEGTDVEGALAPLESVRRLRGVVAEDEAAGPVPASGSSPSESSSTSTTAK